MKERYGEQKSVTALLKAIRLDRTALDKKEAKRAKDEVDFNDFYRTRSEGQSRRQVMKRDIDIARRWRARHNLETNWWHNFT